MLRTKSVSLLGSYFHTFKDGLVEWQGAVLSRPEEGFYLVQLFEWLTGGASDIKLVKLEDMLSWTFYVDVEDMDTAYKTNWGPKADRAEKSPPRKAAAGSE